MKYISLKELQNHKKQSTSEITQEDGSDGKSQEADTTVIPSPSAINFISEKDAKLLG